MTLTDEQIRQKFEEWYRTHTTYGEQTPASLILEPTRDGNGYYYPTVDKLWRCWQTAISLQGEAVPIDDNAWELLAMELAEDDHDDIHQLIYEGYPPEPWGEVWMRYESEAKRILKLAAKYTSPPPTTAQQSELTELREMLIAAGEEIQAHWEAHCDEEGYGPNNLLSRIERGLVQSYPGYSVGAFNKIQQDKTELIRKCAAILDSWAETAFSYGFDEDADNYREIKKAILALLPEEGKG